MSCAGPGSPFPPSEDGDFLSQPPPVTDGLLGVLPWHRDGVAPAGSSRPRRELLHRIRVAGRNYAFLFFDERYVSSDGRRVYWVRTPTGVERIDVHPGERILYLGAEECSLENPARQRSSADRPSTTFTSGVIGIQESGGDTAGRLVRLHNVIGCHGHTGNED